MIIDNKQGMDVLEAGDTRIAFAVNTEGCNTSGFAGLVARKFWPELANIGECELGTVLTKETSEGFTFYALVCNSLKHGWYNQTEIIKKCFDAIETDDPIATVSIGCSRLAILSGADFCQIRKGMELSKKQLYLY